MSLQTIFLHTKKRQPYAISRCLKDDPKNGHTYPPENIDIARLLNINI